MSKLNKENVFFFVKKTVIKTLFIAALMIITSCVTSKNMENTVRDGSSFDKAIIVNNVSEEYKYVKEVCPDCKMLVQYLVFHKRKPYDILKFKKANGEEISYYFDISKFYGKGF